MNTSFLHRAATVLLIILLLLLANPYMFWMPSSLLMLLLTLATALLFIWLGFLLTEEAKDEREALHRTDAGRAAYLSAAAMLAAALIWQGLTHTIDVWIPATLAVMVTAKLVSRSISDAQG